MESLNYRILTIILAAFLLLAVISQAGATAIVIPTSSDCSAAGTATYSSGIITVNSGTNTLCTIYKDINNSAVLSRAGNTYTLNANMVVADGAMLYINGSTLQFGGEFRLWGKGGSTVNIDNSNITSIGATGGRILMRRESLVQGLWNFKLTNSIVSNLGSGGLDEFGEAKIGLFLYPSQTDNLGDGNKHAGSTVYITNNDFSQIQMKMGDLGDYDVIFSDNTFHDATFAGQYAVHLQKGEVSNNQFYDIPNFYNIVYTYGDPRITGNTFQNIGLWASGGVIVQKEGSGGAIIENNTIDGITSGAYAIYLMGSNHIKWGAVSNNTIKNSPSLIGITMQGNGYLGGYDMLFVVENNTLSGLSKGLQFGGYSYFTANKAPRHVITRNNRVTNSGYGYWVNGYEFYNVSSNNDFMTGNDYDLWVGDTFIDNSYPPFINTQYSTISVKNSATYFKNYKYLDVKVVYSNNNPINGISVSITNTIDSNYPSINIEGQTKTTFITGTDGHTPLPSDTANSAAILDFWKTLSAQQQMTYTITAEKNGKTASLTDLNIDASWYRENPEQPTKTVVLNIDTGSGYVETNYVIDLDGNGVINILDIVMVAQHFGENTTCPTACPAPNYDIDSNGSVNILDIRLVAEGM